MTKDDNEDNLPDKDAAKEFYAKYEPKEILGKGISSTVRRCVEKETGIEFAAKIIDTSSDSNNYLSTKEEIRILRLVAGHPYIIHLHDVFESETFIFLVFELCKNGELFDYLTSVVTLTEKKTRFVMRQLLEALLYVHDNGVVHRDLKPENILLDDATNIKLTDFGFARYLKENELLTDLCGTPGYLAPEVLRINMYGESGGYSHAVDMWACGVIMFTLLAGRPPFWHRKQHIMLRHISEGKKTNSFDSPEWADISEQAIDLINKLLVVNPEKRCTVKEALSHSFFNVTLWEQDMVPLKRSLSMKTRRMSKICEMALSFKDHFDARKKFRFAILCVRAVVRLNRLMYIRNSIAVNCSSTSDPYKLKPLRKLIDSCAFRVYGHWVKKGEGQNRAALFEMNPKTELRSLYILNISN